MFITKITRYNSYIIEFGMQSIDIACENLMIKDAMKWIDNAIRFGGKAIKGTNNQNMSKNSKIMVSFAVGFQNPQNADQFMEFIKANQ